MDPVSEALRTAHAPTAHEPLRAQALQVRHLLCLCIDLFLRIPLAVSLSSAPSLPSSLPQPTHPPLPPSPPSLPPSQFLDDFKQSENSGEWSFHTLRTPTAPAEARHFALQCLASLLHSRWKGWDGSVRRQFRLAVMELVTSTGAGMNEEVFLRERIGLLVSGVGEKEYPQQWPEMLTDLAAIWDTGGGGGGREGGATPVIIA